MVRAFFSPDLKFNSSEYIERKKGVTIYNNTLKNLCSKSGNKLISGNEKNNGIIVHLDNSDNNQSFGFMKRVGDIETKSYEQRKNIALGRMLLENSYSKCNDTNNNDRNSNNLECNDINIKNSICNNEQIKGDQISNIGVKLSLYQGNLLIIKPKINSNNNVVTCKKDNYLKNILKNNDNNLVGEFISNIQNRGNFVNNILRASKTLKLKNIPIIVSRCK